MTSYSCVSCQGVEGLATDVSCQGVEGLATAVSCQGVEGLATAVCHVKGLND